MSERASTRFRATAGTHQAFGKTPQQALAALMRCMSGAALVPIIIWPYNQGDAYFTEGQQARLQSLRQRQEALTAEERAKLEELIAAAFDASVARTKALPIVKV